VRSCPLGSLFFGPKLSGGIASKENCAPSAIHESELRTCGLGAVVSVLLGAGIGFGWHYLDNGGGRAAIAATPLAQR